jgi:alpha-D-ribose 1-methylphosphonate 5-triphosphate synthase subunit PhnH
VNVAATAHDSDLLPGFANPVFQAQATFRSLLSALAEPGTVHELAAPQAWPEGVPAAMASIGLAMLDHDTPFLVPDCFGLAEYFRFHCGARLTYEQCEAAFVFSPAALVNELAGYAAGGPEYPDRSTTLVIGVESLDSGSALRLRGPGIAGVREVRVKGVPASFWHAWRANHARFPLGVDCFLVSDRHVMGLPRTTSAEEA